MGEFSSSRLYGEDNRTPEFRTACDALVNNVNQWAGMMARARDDEIPLMDGTTIHNTRPVTRSYGRSVTVIGDGVASKITLEAVYEAEDGGTEIVTVEGSDPLEDLLYGYATSAERAKEELISFGVRNLPPSDSAEEDYSGFMIMGDGFVLKVHGGQGWRTGRPLTTADDLKMASDAFADITGLERLQLQQ